MTFKRWLLSLVAALVVLGAGAYLVARPWLLALFEPKPLPVIVVEAAYPGASAQTVADTVAAPIEQQMDGVLDMVYMRSESRNDGTYRLTVAFPPGSDSDMEIHKVLVQNRVSLASPVLPALVQHQGVSVRHQSPDALLFVALTAAKGDNEFSRDTPACIQIKDELVRTSGVGDVVLAGPQPARLLVYLDREKMAAEGLTTAAVVEALRAQMIPLARGLHHDGDADQNVAVEGGADDNPLVITALDRRAIGDEETISRVILKVGVDRRYVQLKDVARVEKGAVSSSHIRCDGKPAVLLAVYPTPGAARGEVARAVQDQVTSLRKRLPDWLALDVALDFSTRPECLRIDLELPASASMERTLEATKQCATIAAQTPGVANTLILCGPPSFHADNEACVVARLEPARGGTRREEIIQGLRKRLAAQVPGALARVCDLSAAKEFTTAGYPIDLAVQNLDDNDDARQLAEKLAERLRQSAKVVDVWRSRDGVPPQLRLKLDRTKARAQGVLISDVFAALQLHLGSYYVNNFTDRIVDMTPETAPTTPQAIEGVKQLRVRSNTGQMVALAALVEVRAEKGSAMVERLDGYPIVRITANPAVGVSPTQARAFCEEQFQAVRKELGLPEKYRLIGMKGQAAAK